MDLPVGKICGRGILDGVAGFAGFEAFGGGGASSSRASILSVKFVPFDGFASISSTAAMIGGLGSVFLFSLSGFARISVLFSRTVIKKPPVSCR